MTPYSKRTGAVQLGSTADEPSLLHSQPCVNSFLDGKQLAFILKEALANTHDSVNSMGVETLTSRPFWVGSLSEYARLHHLDGCCSFETSQSFLVGGLSEYVRFH